MTGPNPPGSAWARFGRGARRVVSLTTLVLVTASTLLLGVVVVGGATGRWRLLPVRTGSMTPHAPQGSVIVVHPTPVSRVRRGDVIVFQAPIPGHPLVVHRVYRLLPGRSGPVVLTKGDANPVPDPWRFRIRSQTVWRGGMVVPELGNLLFLLESGDARVATLATATALVAMIGLAAIWTSDLITISWRPPEASLPYIWWRADGAPSRRALRRRASAAQRDRRARQRAERKGYAHRELIPVAVAVLAVGTATVIGSGVLATFTGPAAATATYATGNLAAPTGLACQWTAATNVKLTWTDASPTFTTGYKYLRSATSGSGYSSIGTTVGESSTTGNDTSPGAGTVHYYVTEATHGSWTSANSNQDVSTGCTEAISLVAGNGTAGFTGDTGAATAAELNGAVGVAADSAGNIYIADTTNNRIRKVTAAGIISTFAGGGASTACSFSGAATSLSLSTPSAVAVTSGGAVFITDSGHNCVRKISAGTVSQVAGTGTASYSGDNGYANAATLSNPGQIWLTSAGDLLVADHGNNRVRKVGTP